MTAGEHDRARRDPGRRSPERRPAAERADDPLAEDADEDRPDRRARRVQRDGGAGDVERLAERGQSGSSA